MATTKNRRRANDRRRVWDAALYLPLCACGGGLSTDERWNADTTGLPLVAIPALDCPSAAAPGEPASCGESEPIFGYQYADPPAFWLGSQDERAIDVGGAGFFVSDDASTSEHARRFATQALLSVGPDGFLEDRGGHALLGYGPFASVGDPCVGRLRAPLFAPPEVTRRISIGMNLDPREFVTTFDILNPDGTSNSSTSVQVIDSLGALHLLDLYFNNAGGNLFAYNVVADGSDLAGGTPGVHTLLSTGFLQFTSDGALDTATTPELAISFSNGPTAHQAIAVDFGPDITTDGDSGYGGSTSFGTSTFVSSQSVDGYLPGTGSDVRIASSGEVTVDFDSGASLVIGRLALARFANEDRLIEQGDGSLRATAGSGPAQFGAPTSPGRGPLAIPLR
jgi:flagellar hook protein FlgE